MIKLSKRLDAISSLVPKGSNAIDVGCDHGLLDIYLHQKKITNKIIATDINRNAISNAKENIKKNKLEKQIETRLGNGIDVLKENDNIDTIIISGMGAHTIVGILNNNKNKLKSIKTIIIQSNTKVEFLRKSLIKLKFKIANEIMIEDNKKIYTIIKFIKGRQKYTKIELFLGPQLIKDNTELFRKYCESELEKQRLLLKLLPKNKIIEKYKIKKKIKLYQQVII